jgi:hypothetical protein
LNFKASAAETGIYYGVKTIFLESTVHKLSTNALLVYQKTVHEELGPSSAYERVTWAKQCEHILLTSCWNSIATSLLQVFTTFNKPVADL